MTNDPLLAAEADGAGVDRIGVDLEQLGKAERQAGHNTRVSQHSWEDFSRVGAAIAGAELFARLNPVNRDTAAEIERALELGVEVLMLPYFHTVEEVATFVRLVRGRALVVVLIETAAALVRIRDVLAVPGIDEAMIGLNDLRLQIGVANHFEVLVSPLIDAAAEVTRRRGLPFSVGGVGRVDAVGMPVPPQLVLAQYPRLGATGALVARAFSTGVSPDFRFDRAIADLRGCLDDWAKASPQALEAARDELARHAAAWHP